MKFKYYMAFSAIFCFLLGIYAYSLDLGSYSFIVPHFHNEITLPIALWLILLIFIFFICTLVLFGASFALELVRSYQTKSDFDKLLLQINSQALNKPIENKVYKNANIASISKILERFYLKPRLDSKECFEPKIDKLFEDYKNVMSGKNVDLKAYNLDKENKFSIQNNKNKIEKDKKFAFSMLTKAEPKELRDFAIKEILKFGDKKELEKLFSYEITLEPCMKESLIESFMREKDAFSTDFLAKSLQQVGFTQSDYLNLAKSAKKILEPDSWYKLFENLANNDEKAEIALFYVMLELEMIDKVREHRALHGKDELRFIDAYLDLRDTSKRRYGLDIFFNQFS